MATKKSLAVQSTTNGTASDPQDAVPTSKAELDKQTVAWATPGTMSERGYVLPLPRTIEYVVCDLYPGLEGFSVGINIGVAVRVIEGEDAPGETAVERVCRRMTMIAPAFTGWALIDPLTLHPIPCPDPGDWETYKPLVLKHGPLTDLQTWIMTVGLIQAVRQSAKTKNS